MESTWQKKMNSRSARDELLAGAQLREETSSEVHDGKVTDPAVVAQRRMVQRGLRDHRETTQSAMRALQIAEQTADIGQATLSEVQRQGQGLDNIERGLDTMDEEVKEASSLIKFMRRFCLFQVLCCCCCDPDVQRDRTRQKRLKQRRLDDRTVQKAMSLQKEDQIRDLDAIMRNEIPEVVLDEDEQERAKIALKYNIGSGSTGKVPIVSDDGHHGVAGVGYNPQRNAAIQSGAMTEAEIQEIQEENMKQDKILSKLDKAVDSLKAMSYELNRELQEQEPQISSISDRAQTTHTNIGSLVKQARRI